ncbi:toll/interleukin-1 receptor domain-containing protein [Streptomyces sp. NBC_00237]|uniref:toll/interleukin-1 receptor domain-containing protein n=1 Tax=Streptomyces sp. NBC_00237 TaxID=2975687 RepID=UPI002254D1E9|nr:toll/interleukin-1 receptor domain-containing protein [Streptomyces sp. NBC_00237]MCX5201924.1 toll/interleukin-1 receptor domain-containing protein [Streptomyces sp. NBC_00237]
MFSVWDVFFSYSRDDADRVRPLLDALRESGLKVFTDEAGVASFSGISDTIRRELANSRALLAYYSTGYPERQACQWELTTAYLVGLGEGDPRRRVMVVNPEPGTAHIQPVELRDARHADGLGADADPAALAALAADVRTHVAALDTPMSAPLADGRSPRWLPGPQPSAAPEFTGRLPELWRVHSALHEHAAPLVTGRASARAVQIRGMAGVGKTLLAQEYALRFGAAFPGGVCWLDATSPGSYETDLEALRRRLEAPDLYAHFEAAAAPFLFVVDGLPPRLAPRDAARLAAPHPLGRTLFTTRGRGYAALAAPVDLGPLDPEHAYALAGSRELAASAEGHPLALALLARAGRPADALYTPGPSPLDTLAGDDITSALVRDADTADAQDVLRCAAALHPLPLTAHDAARALAAADSVPRAVAQRRAEAGVRDLEVCSMLTRERQSGRTASTDPHWHVHPVTLHAWRHHDPSPARTEALRHAVLRTLHGATLGSAGLPGGRKESDMPTSPSRTNPLPPPSESERMAAFDIQTELVTRIGIQELPPGGGNLREALTSLYGLFPFVRETLRRYSVSLAAAPADTDTPHVRAVAYRLLNDTLRPFTTTWHPLLTAYEATRPASVTPQDHEAAWPDADRMRAELTALRGPLLRISADLAAISGADFGLTAAG